MNETKTTRNKAIRFRAKTAIKKVGAAIVAGDKTAAQAQLISAIAEISKTTTRGVYHENTTSRKISCLTKAVSAMT